MGVVLTPNGNVRDEPSWGSSILSTVMHLTVYMVSGNGNVLPGGGITLQIGIFIVFSEKIF